MDLLIPSSAEVLADLIRILLSKSLITADEVEEITEWDKDWAELISGKF